MADKFTQIKVSLIRHRGLTPHQKEREEYGRQVDKADDIQRLRAYMD
jgi:hypothetical protein